MASLRKLVLLLPLLVYCPPPAIAQPQIIGPICMKMAVGESEQTFRIFALPMGESQYLLSALSLTIPWSGSASVTNDGTVSYFTLFAGSPFPQTQAPALIVSGAVNLQTGVGVANCAVIDAPPMMEDAPPCTTITQATLTGVTCN